MKRNKLLLLLFSIVGFVVLLIGFTAYNPKKESSKISSQVINSDNKSITNNTGHIDGIYQYINSNSKDTYNVDLKELSNGDISVHYTVQAPHEDEEDNGTHHDHDHGLDTIDYASGILSKSSDDKWTGILTNLMSNSEWDVETSLSGNNLNLKFISSSEFKISGEEKVIISKNPNYKFNLVLNKLTTTK